MFSLSILIPTFNGRHHLERCLLAVRRHAPAGTQVIVADDGSTDGTAEWLRQEYPEVELLRLAGNQGFCRAMNAGLERVRGDVVEMLNNDTEVCAGWADAALRHFADPTIGSVAPLVLRMDEPDRIDSCGQDYRRCGWAIARGYRQRLGPEYLVRGEVFGPSASSGFYRRAALAKTRGFLPEYEAYLEDTDLAFRLRWAGYRCIYEPDARVYHRGSASYDQHSGRVTRLLARNEEFNFWMNLPASDLLKGLLPHLGFVLVRALRQALRGRLRPFVQGKFQALAAWRQIAQRRREIQDLARDMPASPQREARASGIARATEPLALASRCGLATSSTLPGTLRAGWRWLLKQQLP